jgi:hypothetical protein
LVEPRVAPAVPERKPGAVVEASRANVRAWGATRAGNAGAFAGALHPRSGARRAARLLAAMAWGWAAAAPVLAACKDELPALAAPAPQQVESGQLRVVFAPRPWPIAVGQHFAVDGVVCGPAGQAAPVLLRVDAEMPLHRHGMNYRATVQMQGDGRFVADGLMFHMPGRWRFVFEIDPGDEPGAARDGTRKPVRLTQDIEVE